MARKYCLAHVVPLKGKQKTRRQNVLEVIQQSGTAKYKQVVAEKGKGWLMVL